jgi:hypothetical protein
MLVVGTIVIYRLHDRSSGTSLVVSEPAPTPAPAPDPTPPASPQPVPPPTPVAPQSPAPSPQPSPKTDGTYPLHSGIQATIFWVGEGPTAENAFITNVEGAWNKDWVKAYGGVDTPDSRNGYLPSGFTPKENPFYFALPFGDYTRDGPKKDLSVIPWARGALKAGDSFLKNRWISVEYGGKTAYAQWEDVGPMEENDSAYVFGSSKPKFVPSGLDLSPATATYLGFKGSGKVNWRFVTDTQVPGGPWRSIVTTSPPQW